MAIMRAIENYHQPRGKVFAANNRFIAVFIIIALSISVAVAFFPMGFYSWADDRLRDASIPDTNFTYFDMGYDTNEEFRELQNDEFEDLFEYLYATAARFWDAMGIVVSVVLALIIIATIYVVIVFGSRIVKRWYAKPRTAGGDAITSLETSLLDDLLGLLPRGGRLFLHPVRRAYFKKVNRHIRKGMYVSVSDTTGSIGSKIRPSENIDELTATYEKVRYGRKEG